MKTWITQRVMSHQSHTPFPESGLESPEPAIPAVEIEERQLLDQAQSALSTHGFYAYMMLDEQQQWCVAADDEEGRVDIYLDAGDYLVRVCGTSPGLFMEEESLWRRQALERLARRVVPNVAQGMLEAHQTATWSDEEQGVTVCTAQHIPADSPEQLPVVTRQALGQIDDLLTLVESQLRS